MVSRNTTIRIENLDRFLPYGTTYTPSSTVAVYGTTPTGSRSQRGQRRIAYPTLVAYREDDIAVVSTRRDVTRSCGTRKLRHGYSNVAGYQASRGRFPSVVRTSSQYDFILHRQAQEIVLHLQKLRYNEIPRISDGS